MLGTAGVADLGAQPKHLSKETHTRRSHLSETHRVFRDWHAFQGFGPTCIAIRQGYRLCFQIKRVITLKHVHAGVSNLINETDPQVEYERKQDAKRRKRDQEERARRKAKAKAEAAALEAAYDDEVAELEAALAAVDEATGRPLVGVEAEDASGNTGLSEAAAGGSAAAARLLLDLGADPNRRGQYGRTPLWRAAFMGKVRRQAPKAGLNI